MGSTAMPDEPKSLTQQITQQMKAKGLTSVVEVLTSKKAWCAGFGLLVVFGWIPIQEPQRTQVLYLCMTYVLGQGLADIGKNTIKR